MQSIIYYNIYNLNALLNLVCKISVFAASQCVNQSLPRNRFPPTLEPLLQYTPNNPL